MKGIVPALAVESIERSLQFYADVLGFATEFSLPGPDGSLVHASIKRGESVLMFGKRDPNNPHDQGRLGAGVALVATVNDDEDIDAYFQQVKAAGASIVQEPTDQFWGHRDWIIADPDGYLLWIGKEMRSVTAEEMQEAMAAGAPA
jgi:PhnB protein